MDRCKALSGKDEKATLAIKESGFARKRHAHTHFPKPSYCLKPQERSSGMSDHLKQYFILIYINRESDNDKATIKSTCLLSCCPTPLLTT